MIHLLTIFADETAAPSGVAALGFDPKAFIIQLITFLLVFWLLKRYAFGPIVNMLDKRRTVIEEGVSLTAEMVAQKDKLEAEVAKTTKNARKEADEILARTQEQSTALIKEAEETAQSKVDAMLADAQTKIKDETDRARRKLEKDVLALVVEATEIIVGEKIDERKDSQLLERALKGKA